MTFRGVRRARAGAAAAALLVGFAVPCAADTTYASTVAASPSPQTPRRAGDVPAAPGARLTVAASADGASADRLSIDFAPPPRGEIRPCVVWTGGAATRIDLTDVAWDGAGTRGRRAEAPSSSDAAALGKYVAEMAWSSGVSDAVPGLAVPDAFKSGGFVVDAVSTPEPGAAALFALGFAGLGVLAWSRRRRVG